MEMFPNDPSRWFGVATAILVTWFIVTAASAAFRQRLKEHTTPEHRIGLLGRVLVRTHQLLPIGLGLLIFVGWMDMSDGLRDVLHATAAVALGAQGGLYLAGVLDFFFARRAPKGTDEKSGEIRAAVEGVLVWSLVIVVALTTFGLNFTGLLVSLGIGGIAVVLRKSDLIQSRIRDVQGLANHRVVVVVRLSYQSPIEKLKQVPELARRTIGAQPIARFDRAHLLRFGESLLEFEIAYFVRATDQRERMNAQQAVALALCESLRLLGLEFALPSEGGAESGAKLRSQGDRQADSYSVPANSRV